MSRVEVTVLLKEGILVFPNDFTAIQVGGEGEGKCMQAFAEPTGNNMMASAGCGDRPVREFEFVYREDVRQQATCIDLDVPVFAFGESQNEIAGEEGLDDP